MISVPWNYWFFLIAFSILPQICVLYYNLLYRLCWYYWPAPHSNAHWHPILLLPFLFSTSFPPSYLCFATLLSSLLVSSMKLLRLSQLLSHLQLLTFQTSPRMATLPQHSSLIIFPFFSVYTIWPSSIFSVLKVIMSKTNIYHHVLIFAT